MHTSSLPRRRVLVSAVALGLMAAGMTAGAAEAAPLAETTSVVGATAASTATADGLVAYDSGDYKAAIELFTNAIAIDPSVARPYYWRGRAEYKLKSFEAAQGDFTKVIELRKKPVMALYWRGRSSYKLGQLDAAIKDFNATIELSPKYASAYYGRALTLAKAGHPKEALVDANKALELDPSRPSFAKLVAKLTAQVG
jgi:tetratricopeptide (TPR) repeat protein